MLKIRIERTFVDLTDDVNYELEYNTNLWGWSPRLNDTWSELLKSPRVLLVSEAGTGKTHECVAEQRKLWEEGHPAFFLELSELAKSECFEDMLSQEELERFSQWKTAQFDTATFFLDSIDELRLTRENFSVALKKFAKAVSGKLAFIHVVITSRPPIDSELKKIQRFLPIPEKELESPDDEFADYALRRNRHNTKDEVKQWRKVGLVPLNDAQIKQLAESFGVKDSELFLKNLHQFNSVKFAERPKDLIDLCSIWVPGIPFGSLSEQMEKNIGIKLNPHREGDSDSLSIEKANEGACRLALSCLLTRKLTIRFSKESDVGYVDTALEPSIILNDWNEREIKELLNRSLFTNASYGRVRFHHRSVLEYLASKQLNTMLGEGKPIREIKRILLGETPQGIKVLKPSLRSVTSWLALNQNWLFEEVLLREPAVLFLEGDPGFFTDELKVKILRAYMAKPEDGIQRGSWIDQQNIARISSPRLAKEAEIMWKDGIDNRDCRFMVLRLMNFFPSVESSDLMYELLNDPAENIYDRRIALNILVNLDDERLKEIATSIQSKSELWDSKLLSYALTLLYPKYLSKDELRNVIESIELEDDTEYEIDSYWPKLIAEEQYTVLELDELRQVLTEIIESNSKWDDNKYLYSCDRQHLINPLLAVCNRMITLGEATKEVLYSSVLLYRLSKDVHSIAGGSCEELATKIRKLSSEKRECTFWMDVKFVEENYPQSKNESFRKIYWVNEGLIRLDPNLDKHWVIKTLSDSDESIERRKDMLTASVRYLIEENIEYREYIEGLREYVLDSEELLKEIEVMLTPQPRNETFERLEEENRKRAEKNAIKEQQNIDSWKLFWKEINEDPEKLFSEEYEEGTIWDLWKVMRQEREFRESSGWNRGFIEKYFDENIADKAKESLKKLWRKHSPTLPSERDSENNKILMIWEVGLTGISAESEDPYWAGKLSPEEAKLASRYVPMQMNGFPSWLESLVSAHLDSVKAVLCHELLHEINSVTTQNTYFYFLQSIEYASESVREVFIPTLLDWLKSHGQLIHDVKNVEHSRTKISRVINIVLKSQNEKDLNELAELAQTNTETNSETQLLSAWLPTLISLNPRLGVEKLSKLLEGEKPEQYGPAVTWFCSLFKTWNDANIVSASLERFTPDDLVNLIKIAYKYIRPQDDLEHKGVFSPDERDDAQTARSQLLNILLKSTGTDAWNAKIRLSEEPLFSGDYKKSILREARENAATEIDQVAYLESDVTKFIEHGYSSPQSNMEMFQIIKDKIADLEELLLSDFSPREQWADIKVERVMRRAIGRELQVLSNGMYRVTQESVTADEKETDLRLETLNVQGVIELKIGENHSGKALRKTIREQLFARYMAPEDRRSGCLLITVAKENKEWEHPDTHKLIDSSGLREMLEQEANDLMEEMSYEIQIAIRILDLRKRID